MADGKPIIVIKKKGGHGGHHGGAWKIAYADFVTAMMCFFMVMWLVNTATVVTKENIASYFRQPGLFETGSGTPLMTGQTGILDDAFAPNNNFKAGTQGGKNDTVEPGVKGDEEGTQSSFGQESDRRSKEQKEFSIVVPKTDIKDGEAPTASELGVTPDTQASILSGQNMGSGEIASFEQVANEIENLFKTSPELEKLLGQVDVKIDSDGLNIEVADSDKTSMFQVGSARILPEAEAAFGKLGEIIGKLDNTIDIVGHTDARPFAAGDKGYSNWELSTDRANAARRALQKQNINSDRITSVVGMADKLLREYSEPMAPENRRISLKVRFRVPQPTKLDSNKLNEIMNSRSSAQNSALNAAASTGNTAKNIKDKSTAPTAHTFTPKEIVKAVKRESNNAVKLPPERSRDAEPAPTTNVFKQSPILGAPDAFDF
jgi:chemotaxis protein MotB